MSDQPLNHVDDWEESLQARYPAPEKTQDEFRNYAADVRPTVREFYRLNHRHQTLESIDKFSRLHFFNPVDQEFSCDRGARQADCF